jgi:predicted transcriptional regulator
MRFADVCVTLSHMKASTLLDAANSSTYTIRIPTPLKQAFDEIAGLHERNGSQLVREFMRDYVQSNAKQAQAHQEWFISQVNNTRQQLKAGQQASTASESVHAWLASWGTDAELAAPKPRAKGKQAAQVHKRA